MAHLGELYSFKKDLARDITFSSEFMDLAPSDPMSEDIHLAWHQLTENSLAVDRIIFRSDSVIRYVVKESTDHRTDGWSRSFSHEIVFNPRHVGFDWYQCEKFINEEIDPEWSTVGYICNVGH